MTQTGPPDICGGQLLGMCVDRADEAIMDYGALTGLLLDIRDCARVTA